MTFERYAIYWAPKPASALDRFGRAWLDNDKAERETFFDAPNGTSLDRALIERATASPRRYRLHATLKAPFRLDFGQSEDSLSKALAAFCARRRVAQSGPLLLHRFTRYLALVPESRRADIEWLADECVTHFDRFRAPLSGAERSRRSSHLMPCELSHLEQFGYPHIFNRFFFHITLAGPLEDDELTAVEGLLAPAVKAFTRSDFCLDALCLFGDPGKGAPFEMIARYPLMH